METQPEDSGTGDRLATPKSPNWTKPAYPPVSGNNAPSSWREATMDAPYAARCWAESRSNEEIQAEIDRLDRPLDYTQHKAGSAHHDYLRCETLKELITERNAAVDTVRFCDNCGFWREPMVFCAKHSDLEPTVRKAV